tara:strand:- start:74 stop:280 length:207 start_codon:yes stop_codon:yes gene_type:complete
MIEQISNIIETVLKENNWAVYYKNTPLAKLPVEGDAPIYKVNEVSYETLIESIKSQIISKGEEVDTQG